MNLHGAFLIQKSGTVHLWKKLGKGFRSLELGERFDYLKKRRMQNLKERWDFQIFWMIHRKREEHFIHIFCMTVSITVPTGIIVM